MMYKIYHVSGMHVHGIQVNWCLCVANSECTVFFFVDYEKIPE